MAISRRRTGFKIAHTCTRKELAAAPVPAGHGRWSPCSHTSVLECVDNQLNEMKLKVIDERIQLTQDKSRFFGTLTVEGKGTNGDSYNLAVGVRNSNDKALAAGLAFGTRVVVCSNLSFSGDIVLKRKHTIGIHADMPLLIREAMVVGVDVFTRYNRELFSSLSERELKSLDVNDIIVEGLRKKVYEANSIPAVLKHWDTPEHKEFAPRTAYSLYNAVTSALAETTKNPFTHDDRTQRLTRMFGERFDIKSPESMLPKGMSTKNFSSSIRAAALSNR